MLSPDPPPGFSWGHGRSLEVIYCHPGHRRPLLPFLCALRRCGRLEGLQLVLLLLDLALEVADLAGEVQELVALHFELSEGL